MSAIAVSIVGAIMAAIVIVVAIEAIYKCAAMKIRLKEDRRNRDHEANINEEWTSDLSMDDEAPGAEHGSLTGFVDAIQKERPVRFSSQQLRAFTRNYAQKVGSGGFGVVYKGRFPDGTPVAVKMLNTALSKHAKEQFTAEVGTIGRTYHVNLVRLYGFCLDVTVKALVYEYMEHGSLDRYIFNPPPEKKVQFEVVHDIALGTAKALRYLHEECAQRIIHYDIKPQNVLLGSGMVPKVADFGLARLCNREDTHLTITGARGTPGYAAPELWMPQPVTHKCDVYSFGMLLFEIVGRRRNLELGVPHVQDSQEWYPQWVWHRVEAGEIDAVLSHATSLSSSGLDRERAERLCKVALWCVQFRPVDRPTMGSVVRMLEGEDQIAPPRNPFGHLAPYGTTTPIQSGQSTSD